MLLLDSGDVFVAGYQLPASQRASAIDRAQFIIDAYNRAGVDAMTFGDRDLLLGREPLEALAKRARFPIVAANLVDTTTKAPVFEPGVVIERAGIKVGIIGLLTETGAARVLRSEFGRATRLAVTDPAIAAREAKGALEAKGAELFVVLSHLSEPEEVKVAAAVPELRLFLGGQSPSARGEPRQVGEALAVLAGQKGKQLAITTAHILAANGPGAKLVDRDGKKKLERRLKLANARVTSLERRIAQAKAQQEARAKAAAKATPASRADPGVAAPSRALRSPVEMYERQLAAAHAQVKSAEQALAAAGEADATSNWITQEMVQLGRNVTPDPAVKAAVDAFLARGAAPKTPVAPARSSQIAPEARRGPKPAVTRRSALEAPTTP